MAIRQFLDGIEHHFEKGGKYERWYALYEAVDTIFYSPASVTKTTAHSARKKWESLVGKA